MYWIKILTSTRNSLYLLFFLLLFLPSCQSDRLKEKLITIDVSKNYPEKVIDLNTIANIQYVILDDSIDFLFKGSPRYITDNNIVIQDAVSKDILFFSRDGTPKSRFNRVGSGPNEFSHLKSMLYDEIKDELFIIGDNKIGVYSLMGEFIRKFSLLEDASISEIREFNSESLLIYDVLKSYDTDFSLISKENGEVLNSIDLPVNLPLQMYVMETDGNRLNFTAGPTSNIVQHKNGFLLTNHSSDSVYLYTENKHIEPILVRIPPVQEMNPVIYLNSFVESSQYQFMQVVEVKTQNNRLPSAALVRDKGNNKIYKQKILWSDFRGKELEIIPGCLFCTNNPEVGFFELDIEELFTANVEGRLSGDLKNVTDYAEQKNNSNNVYMFMHFK